MFHNIYVCVWPSARSRNFAPGLEIRRSVTSAKSASRTRQSNAPTVSGRTLTNCWALRGSLLVQFM